MEAQAEAAATSKSSMKSLNLEINQAAVGRAAADFHLRKWPGQDMDVQPAPAQLANLCHQSLAKLPAGRASVPAIPAS
jgi:hypothetical protein